MFIWLVGKRKWTQIQNALSKLHPNWSSFGAAEFMNWPQAYGVEAIVHCLLETNGEYDLKDSGKVRPSFSAKERRASILGFLDKPLQAKENAVQQFLLHFGPHFANNEREKEQGIKDK